MYSSEAIKEIRRDNWERSSWFSNEGSTWIDMEARRFGKWSQSHGKKGDATERRKMVATGYEWKSAFE
jgi:hypothetical protein